jgi:hypothetical protein
MAEGKNDKTIVVIGRNFDCIPKQKMAKSGLYNFESSAFNHSATLPAESVFIKTSNPGGVNLNSVNIPRLTIHRRFTNVVTRSIKNQT